MPAGDDMPLFGADGNRFSDGMWHIGRDRGFLPAVDPSPILPSPDFDALQQVLTNLPVWKDAAKQEHGLLGTPNAIVGAVQTLPNLLPLVSPLDPSLPKDIRLLQILFRGYAFLTSGYLLESAYHGQGDGEHYGKARAVLPKQLAQPFWCVADKLGQRPWLEYHYAYSLGNYVKKDEAKGFHWSNLGMAVCFSGLSDETGFIMLHVHINAKTGNLLGAIEDTLEASKTNDETGMVAGIDAATQAMRDINEIRKQMWKASRPDHYNDFRAFIMGVAGNEAIFGDNGIVYEGVEVYAGQGQKPRGQTGAQDDVVPTCDIFSGLTAYYPTNRLTEYLLDLRSYRPTIVQQFFQALTAHVQSSSFLAHLESQPLATAAMLAFVQEIFQFRNGHWQFVQRYIMQQTRHQTATGGTPITSWLPNQLEAALAYIQDMLRRVEPRLTEIPEERRKEVRDIAKAQMGRVPVLRKQMKALESEDYDGKEVYRFNELTGFDEV